MKFRLLLFSLKPAALDLDTPCDKEVIYEGTHLNIKK